MRLRVALSRLYALLTFVGYFALFAFVASFRDFSYFCTFPHFYVIPRISSNVRQCWFIPASIVR